MYKKEGKDIELERKLKFGKKDLLIDFKKTFETQNKTLDLIVKGVNHTNFNKFEDSKKIWNLAGFVNIVSFDLKIAGRDMALAESEWEKRYYGRQACLIIYETINDLFDLLGKDFKELISRKIKGDDIEDRLKNIKKELVEYKKLHFVKLQEIRNIAIAHRDNDILNQINIIFNMSWFETLGIVTSFDKILNQLGEVIQIIMNRGLIILDELKEQIK